MKTLEDEKIALKCELARLREEHEKLGYQYEQAQKEIARLNGEIGFLQGKISVYECVWPHVCGKSYEFDGVVPATKRNKRKAFRVALERRGEVK